MKCERARKVLLVDKNDTQVAEHLKGCSECQRFVAEVEAISTGLATAPMIASPSSVWGKVSDGSMSRGRTVRTPALAFGLAALLIMAILLWPRSNALAATMRAAAQTSTVQLVTYHYHERDETYPDGEFRPEGWEQGETWIKRGAYRHEGRGGNRTLRRDGQSWALNPRTMTTPVVSPRDTTVYSSDVRAEFRLESPDDSPAEITELGSVRFGGKQLKVIRAKHPEFTHTAPESTQRVTSLAHDDYLWIDETTTLPVCLISYRLNDVGARYRSSVTFFDFNVEIDPQVFEPATMDRLYGRHQGEALPQLPPMP